MKSKQFTKFLFLMLIVSIVLIPGCTRKVVRTAYYLLDYHTTALNEKLKLEEPLPFRVQVMTFKIPRSFDSIRIIARHSTHQINYYRYSLWAVRPQTAVADLLAQHINDYGLFQECQREYLSKRADLEISGEIFQIEIFSSDKYSAAHLKMIFELYDRTNDKRLIVHQFDRETPIPLDNMTIFAKALSDIVNQEAEVFFEKIVDHFQPPETDSLQVQE